MQRFNMEKTLKVQEVEYKLLSPITFHKDGRGDNEATALFLKAPSRKHAKSARYLKQVFFRAMQEVSASANSATAPVPEKEDNDDALIEPGALVMILMGAKCVDISDCIDALRAILISGAAEIDDDLKLSAFSYDQLCYDDEERLLGVYMVNFLLSFWMKEMSKK